MFPYASSFDMSSQNIKAFTSKIMEMSKKKKRVNVLLPGEIINVMENDVSTFLLFI